MLRVHHKRVYYLYASISILIISIMHQILSHSFLIKHRSNQYCVFLRKKRYIFQTLYYSMSKIDTQDSELSPIIPVKIFNRSIYIKRDDLIINNHHIDNNEIQLNGNKIRKLAYMLNSNNKSNLDSNIIVSYGGIQSNSMLALAKICKYQNKTFYYYTKKVPKHIKSNPIGNLQLALDCGMKYIELDHDHYKQLVSISTHSNSSMQEFIHSLPISLQNHSNNNIKQRQQQYHIVPNITVIPQGGASIHAKEGLYQLAKEIESFIIKSDIKSNWKIYFASGTGTTAYYVNEYFKLSSNILKLGLHIDIIAIPCIGDHNYLLDQMKYLDMNHQNLYPIILDTNNIPKRIFGELYREHYDLWNELNKQTNTEFDLLYTPRAWEIILFNYINNDRMDITNDNIYNSSTTTTTSTKTNNDNNNDNRVGNTSILFSKSFADYELESNLIYYHCGGIEGNPTQLNRYRYNGLI